MLPVNVTLNTMQGWATALGEGSVTPDTLTCMTNNDSILLGQWVVQTAFWKASAIKAIEFHESMNEEGQPHAAD